MHLKEHVKGVFVIRNDRGLHTRPATELVKCASGFKSHLKLCHQKRTANAKSLLSVLSLAACKGAKISIEATGYDAEEAVAQILELANNSFNIKY